MGRAFEDAWSILKAPLDVDSINFDNVNSKTNPVAFFDDPERNERIPMWINTFASPSPVVIGMGDRGKHLWEPDPNYPLETEAEKRGHSLAEALLYERGMQNPNVYWPYVRRGYGTSLYDLAAYYRASQGKVVRPSRDQTEEGRALWEQQIYNQIPPHEQYELEPSIDSQEMRMTDWPDDFHWRPTV